MRYWARRIVLSIAGLITVLTFVFLTGRMLGDPALIMLGPFARPEDVLRVREAIGLDDALVVQYWDFISGAMVGDFGVTLRYGMASGYTEATTTAGIPALPIVLNRLPATFYLAGVAGAIAVVSGVFLGSLGAMKPRSVIDRLVNLISLAGVSVVDFWFGLILILVFAVGFGILPTSGYGGIKYVILPAIALSVRAMGRITQVLRSSMLDELSKPYVQALRAKGFSEWRVVFIHAEKNAAIPSITMIGVELITLITSAVVIEVVFAWPGIGSLLVDALQRRDLPLVEATVAVLALLIIGINLIVDMMYTYLDPRVRFGE